MADPASLFYVKNYRAQRIRMKYGSNVPVTSSNSLTPSSSVSANQNAHSNYTQHKLQRGNFSGTPSGSTWSLSSSAEHHSHFHHPSSYSGSLTSPYSWAPKLSIVSPLRLDPFSNPNFEKFDAGPNKTSSISNSEKNSVPVYRRTLSGGAGSGSESVGRAASADPEGLKVNSIASSHGNLNFGIENGRCTSVEPSGSGFGKGHGNAGYGSLGRFSSSLYSLDGIGTSRTNRAFSTLAKNVANYSWDRSNSDLVSNYVGQCRRNSASAGISVGVTCPTQNGGGRFSEEEDEEESPSKIPKPPPFPKNFDSIQQNDFEPKFWLKKRKRATGIETESFLTAEDEATLARVSFRFHLCCPIKAPVLQCPCEYFCNKYCK